MKFFNLTTMDLNIIDYYPIDENHSDQTSWCLNTLLTPLIIMI